MKVPCAIYRGGTSKPIILTKSALARTARLLMDGSVHVPERVIAA